MADREARIVGERRIARRARDRLGVAVDRDDASARRQPLEYGTRMTAAPEGAVDVRAVGVADERVDRFAQENAQMLHDGREGALRS